MRRIEIRDSIDVYAARRLVRELAREVGFDRAGCQELEIVVSELVSNIVKYGTSGSVEVDALSGDQPGAGVSIVAEDIGPPFRNLELALLDGYDDRGPIDPLLLLKRRGIGMGLGAVLRLTDAFGVDQTPGQPKRISVRRYVVRPRKPRAAP
jgi:anti-sigma regulatory factor (Ser/Thr protein kinase)